MEHSRPPWTPEEVESLNEFQNTPCFHEFSSASGKTLIATTDGWVEESGGPIVQTWAHAWMADGSWRKMVYPR